MGGEHKSERIKAFDNSLISESIAAIEGVILREKNKLKSAIFFGQGGDQKEKFLESP